MARCTATEVGDRFNCPRAPREKRSITLRLYRERHIAEKYGFESKAKITGELHGHTVNATQSTAEDTR